jgi:transposase InsO family protein
MIGSRNDAAASSVISANALIWRNTKKLLLEQGSQFRSNAACRDNAAMESFNSLLQKTCSTRNWSVPTITTDEPNHQNKRETDIGPFCYFALRCT